MKKIFFIFILIIISGCSFYGKGSEETLQKLKTEGKSYFEHLVVTHEYELLLDKIENGDEVLIQGSPLLSQWTDASTSLSLKYALSRAIRKKPDAVMSLIPKYFSVSEVCTIPYIEESIEVEINHINESLSALKNSTKSSDAYIECIDIYKKMSKNITKNSSGR